MTIGHAFRNVAELASGKFPATKHPSFNKIFDVKVFNPECKASPELAQKYGVSMENVQEVVAIQNIVTSDLTWWNPARKTKPQNFKAAFPAAGIDQTGGGGPATCDFCGWKTLTAEDTFGRIEGPYAVTCSNLFKYGAPYQGVVLFKHQHDPLAFNFPQLSDLLTVADGWFAKAILEAQKEKERINIGTSSKNLEEEEEEALSERVQELHPLLVWNCLGRAGASQFHGHAQVMVSAAPFPAMQRESDAVMQYKFRNSDSSEELERKTGKKNHEKSLLPAENEGLANYYHDLVEAHGVAGLARRLVIPGSAIDSGLSVKNLENIIWDDNIKTSAGLSTSAKTATATAHVSLCPTKDAEIVIHGASLTCPAFQMVFYAALRALIDDLGVESFNAGIHNIPINKDINKESMEKNDKNSKNGVSAAPARITNDAASFVPVVARIVSRGRLSSAASDFGGLEVFAGASIGHTDPWTVMQTLDKSLKRALEE